MPSSHILFVTGKLAEPSLRRTLGEIACRGNFTYTVAVLPITVAALATTKWVGAHLKIPPGIDRILLPGLCEGDPALVGGPAGIPAERGPKDLRDLPEYFGAENKSTSYGPHDISILAEINHVPRMDLHDVLLRAESARAAGADVIDLGCDTGQTWGGAGETTKILHDRGFRISIDSFNAAEVEAAIKSGAELVLSVNSKNCVTAKSWGCEVVAVPDVPATLEGLDATIQQLDAGGIRFRIDPVIEPIGFGFAASLGRYLEIRRRYPQAEMLMGVGNLTELTDADSAGVNVMLLGFCQEVGIRSVLTTEVINWCRSCVGELNLARRLVYHACKERVLPKHVEPGLVMLRDPKIQEHGAQTLKELSERVTDPNFRIFAEGGKIHVINGHMFLQGDDVFSLFAGMLERQTISPEHAFYLGYEMSKAVIALTLGKNYVQDQALQWGFLTVPEKTHRASAKSENKN